MKPRVKLVTPQDITIVVACAKLEETIFSDPWSLQSICTAVASPCTRMYAALSEKDKLMGYLFVTQVEDTADIDNIAVSPGFRRQGIASLLLDTALDGMDADAYLEVRASNTPAAALYRKYGFQEIGIRKDYYESPREDAVLMQRPRDVHRKGTESC